MTANRNSFLRPYSTVEEFDALLNTCKTPRTEVFWVDARLAKHILAMNPHNRPLRKGRVEKYRRMILAGKFYRTPQGIVMGVDRILQNGQHRLCGLWSAADADPSVRVQFEIRFGEPPETREHLDDVSPRDTADRLVMTRSYPNARRMKSAAMAIEWAVFGKRNGGDFDIDQFLHLQSKMSAAFEWAQTICTGKGALGLAGVTAGLMLAYAADPDAVARFTENMRTGEELKRDHPALTLRNFALRYRRREATGDSVSIASKTCGALKAFLDGRTLAQAVESSEAVKFFAKLNGLIE